MRVIVDTAVTLVEPTDHRRLHVETDSTDRLPELLDEAGAGYVADGHALVALDWLIARGAAAGGEGAASFAGMVAYATDKGWVNDGGTHVQAHITPLSTPAD